MISYRTRPAFAALGIAPPSTARRPWPLPYQARYFLVYVLSWNPTLRGHNKDLRDRLDFAGNNRKRCIRLSSYRDRRRQVRPRFSPFHSVTKACQDWLRVVSALPATSVLCGGFCFFFKKFFSPRGNLFFFFVEEFFFLF